MQVTINPLVFAAMKNWLSRLDKAIAARHTQWMKELLNEDLQHDEWVWTEVDEDTYNEYNLFCERATTFINGH